MYLRLARVWLLVAVSLAVVCQAASPCPNGRQCSQSPNQDVTLEGQQSKNNRNKRSHGRKSSSAPSKEIRSQFVGNSKPTYSFNTNVNKTVTKTVSTSSKRIPTFSASKANRVVKSERTSDTRSGKASQDMNLGISLGMAKVGISTDIPVLPNRNVVSSVSDPSGSISKTLSDAYKLFNIVKNESSRLDKLDTMSVEVEAARLLRGIEQVNYTLQSLASVLTQVTLPEQQVYDSEALGTSDRQTSVGVNVNKKHIRVDLSSTGQTEEQDKTKPELNTKQSDGNTEQKITLDKVTTDTVMKTEADSKTSGSTTRDGKITVDRQNTELTSKKVTSNTSNSQEVVNRTSEMNVQTKTSQSESGISESTTSVKKGTATELQSENDISENSSIVIGTASTQQLKNGISELTSAKKDITLTSTSDNEISEKTSLQKATVTSQTESGISGKSSVVIDTASTQQSKSGIPETSSVKKDIVTSQTESGSFETPSVKKDTTKTSQSESGNSEKSSVLIGTASTQQPESGISEKSSVIIDTASNSQSKSGISETSSVKKDIVTSKTESGIFETPSVKKDTTKTSQSESGISEKSSVIIDATSNSQSKSGISETSSVKKDIVTLQTESGIFETPSVKKDTTKTSQSESGNSEKSSVLIGTASTQQPESGISEKSSVMIDTASTSQSESGISETASIKKDTVSSQTESGISRKSSVVIDTTSTQQSMSEIPETSSVKKDTTKTSQSQRGNSEKSSVLKGTVSTQQSESGISEKSSVIIGTASTSQSETGNSEKSSVIIGTASTQQSESGTAEKTSVKNDIASTSQSQNKISHTSTTIKDASVVIEPVKSSEKALKDNNDLVGTRADNLKNVKVETPDSGIKHTQGDSMYQSERINVEKRVLLSQKNESTKYKTLSKQSNETVSSGLSGTIDMKQKEVAEQTVMSKSEQLEKPASVELKTSDTVDTIRYVQSASFEIPKPSKKLIIAVEKSAISNETQERQEIIGTPSTQRDNIEQKTITNMSEIPKQINQSQTSRGSDVTRPKVTDKKVQSKSKIEIGRTEEDKNRINSLNSRQQVNTYSKVPPFIEAVLSDTSIKTVPSKQTSKRQDRTRVDTSIEYTNTNQTNSTLTTSTANKSVTIRTSSQVTAQKTEDGVQQSSGGKRKRVVLTITRDIVPPTKVEYGLSGNKVPSTWSKENERSPVISNSATAESGASANLLPSTAKVKDVDWGYTVSPSIIPKAAGSKNTVSRTIKNRVFKTRNVLEDRDFHSRAYARPILERRITIKTVKIASKPKKVESENIVTFARRLDSGGSRVVVPSSNSTRVAAEQKDDSLNLVTFAPLGVLSAKMDMVPSRGTLEGYNDMVPQSQSLGGFKGTPPPPRGRIDMVMSRDGTVSRSQERVDRVVSSSSRDDVNSMDMISNNLKDMVVAANTLHFGAASNVASSNDVSSSSMTTISGSTNTNVKSANSVSENNADVDRSDKGGSSLSQGTVNTVKETIISVESDGRTSTDIYGRKSSSSLVSKETTPLDTISGSSASTNKATTQNSNSVIRENMDTGLNKTMDSTNKSNTYVLESKTTDGLRNITITFQNPNKRVSGRSQNMKENANEILASSVQTQETTFGKASASSSERSKAIGIPVLMGRSIASETTGFGVSLDQFVAAGTVGSAASSNQSVASETAGISGSVDQSVASETVAVSGSVDQSVASETVGISGSVDQSVTSETVGVSGSVDQSVTSETVGVSGSVDQSVASEIVGVAGSVDKSITSEIVGVSGSVDKSVASETVGVSGSVDQSVASEIVGVAGSVDKSITSEIVGVSGSVDKSVTSEIVGVAGSVNQSVASETVSISGSVDQSVASETVGISGPVEQSVASETVGISGSVDRSLASETVGVSGSLDQSLASETVGVSGSLDQSLASETVGVSGSLDQSLASETVGVSGSLDQSLASETVGVSSSLDQPLASETVAVSGSVDQSVASEAVNISGSLDQSVASETVGLSGASGNRTNVELLLEAIINGTEGFSDPSFESTMNISGFVDTNETGGFIDQSFESTMNISSYVDFNGTEGTIDPSLESTMNISGLTDSNGTSFGPNSDVLAGYTDPNIDQGVTMPPITPAQIVNEPNMDSTLTTNLLPAAQAVINEILNSQTVGEASTQSVSTDVTVESPPMSNGSTLSSTQSVMHVDSRLSVINDKSVIVSKIPKNRITRIDDISYNFGGIVIRPKILKTVPTESLTIPVNVNGTGSEPEIILVAVIPKYKTPPKVITLKAANNWGSKPVTPPSFPIPGMTNTINVGLADFNTMGAAAPPPGINMAAMMEGMDMDGEDVMAAAAGAASLGSMMNQGMMMNQNTMINAMSNAEQNVMSNVVQNVMSNVAQNAMSNAVQNVMSNVAQNAMSNAAENVMSNVAQNAMSNAAQNVMSNVAQNVISNVDQNAFGNVDQNVMSTIDQTIVSNVDQNMQVPSQPTGSVNANDLLEALENSTNTNSSLGNLINAILETTFNTTEFNESLSNFTTTPGMDSLFTSNMTIVTPRPSQEPVQIEQLVTENKVIASVMDLITTNNSNVTQQTDAVQDSVAAGGIQISDVMMNTMATETTVPTILASNVVTEATIGSTNTFSSGEQTVVFQTNENSTTVTDTAYTMASADTSVTPNEPDSLIIMLEGKQSPTVVSAITVNQIDQPKSTYQTSETFYNNLDLANSKFKVGNIEPTAPEYKSEPVLPQKRPVVTGTKTNVMSEMPEIIPFTSFSAETISNNALTDMTPNIQTLAGGKNSVSSTFNTGNFVLTTDNRHSGKKEEKSAVTRDETSGSRSNTVVRTESTVIDNFESSRIADGSLGNFNRPVWNGGNFDSSSGTNFENTASAINIDTSAGSTATKTGSASFGAEGARSATIVSETTLLSGGNEKTVSSGSIVEKSVQSGNYVDSAVSSGSTVDSKVFSGSSIDNTISSGSNLESTVSSGSSLDSTVSSGNSLDSTVSTGSSLDSTVSSRSSFDSTVSSGSSIESTVSSGSNLDSTVSSGSSFDSPVSAGSSFDSTVSSGSNLDSTVSSGSMFNSPVSAGSSLDSTVSSGSSIDSTVSSGSSLDSTVSSGNSFDSTVSSGSSLDSTVSSGSSLDSTVSSGSSLDSTVSSGNSVDSTVSSGSELDSTVSSGSSLDSTVTTGNSFDSTVSSGSGLDSTSDSVVSSRSNVGNPVTSGANIASSVTTGSSIASADRTVLSGIESSGSSMATNTDFMSTGAKNEISSVTNTASSRSSVDSSFSSGTEKGTLSGTLGDKSLQSGVSIENLSTDLRSLDTSLNERITSHSRDKMLSKIVLEALCQRYTSSHVDYIVYAPYPGDCSKMVQCIDTGNNMLEPVTRHCPLGLFWDQPYLMCRNPKDVPCFDDPCLTGVYNYTGHWGCRSFYACASAISEPMCCQSGHRYEQRSENYGECVVDASCRDSCDTLQTAIRDLKTASPDCSTFPDDRNKHVYWDSTQGTLQMRACPEGTVYNRDACRCSYEADYVTRRHHSGCRPEFMLDFDSGKIRDVSLGGLSFGHRKITPVNGHALFRGASRIHIWGFINRDLGSTFAIRLRVKPDPGGCMAGPQTIISNCGSFGEPSVDITCHNKQIKLTARTKLYPKAVVIAINFKEGNWLDVKYTYNNQRFSAEVNGRAYSKVMGGNIEVRNNPLVIGKCPKIPGLTGKIDTAAIYTTCIPEN